MILQAWKRATAIFWSIACVWMCLLEIQVQCAVKTLLLWNQLFVGISCCWLLFCCWGGIYWKWDNFGTSRHRFPYLCYHLKKKKHQHLFQIFHLQHMIGVQEGYLRRWGGKQAESIFLNLGCQARSLFGEEEKTTWEVAIDKFNDYMTDLNTRSDLMMEGIMSSQISRELEWVTVISKPSLLPLCSWLILNVRTSAAGSMKNVL